MQHLHLKLRIDIAACPRLWLSVPASLPLEALTLSLNPYVPEPKNERSTS